MFMISCTHNINAYSYYHIDHKIYFQPFNSQKKKKKLIRREKCNILF